MLLLGLSVVEGGGRSPSASTKGFHNNKISCRFQVRCQGYLCDATVSQLIPVATVVDRTWDGAESCEYVVVVSKLCIVHVCIRACRLCQTHRRLYDIRNQYINDVDRAAKQQLNQRIKSLTPGKVLSTFFGLGVSDAAVNISVCVCMCVCACVCACVRTCLHACVRACMRASACERVFRYV